jgi:DNA-binding transcriptional LysR family regulator
MIYSYSMLHTFITVCRDKSFSHAAKTLHKSQSCVSMQIAQMERELCLPLLDRSARPFKLTDAGKKFLEFADLITRNVDHCSTYMKEMAAGGAGELKIGTSTSLAAFLVPPVLANIVREFPNLSIQITVLGRPAVYEAIKRGDIHFGIVLADNPPVELIATPIRREPLYFVGCKTHPLAGKRSVKIGELVRTPFVIGTEGHDYTSMIDRALRAMEVETYSIGLRISNFEGMKKAIGAGIGFGVLPRFAVEAEIKQGILSRIHIKGANLNSSLILVENRNDFVMPTVERIKKIFLNELTYNNSS